MSDQTAGMAPAAKTATFDAFIRRWAAERPDRIALDGPDVRLTYRELDELTARTVTGLMALGIAKGDRIAWFGKNSTLYFVLLFAAGRMGAVMVPIGWRLAPAEVGWIAANAEVKAAFLGEGFDGAREIFAAIETVSHSFTAAEAWDWVRSQPESDFTAAGPQDAVLQLYTSGTTGKPKGVVLSNYNLFGLHHETLGMDSPYHRIDDDEAILIAMPCAHIGGTGLGTMCLSAGVAGIVLAEFDPRMIFDAVEKKGVTRFFMVPAALQLLLNHPDCGTVDYSRLRYILYGAAPIPLQLLKESIAMFGAGFLQCYGMTETTGTISVLPPEDHSTDGNKRMRSAGKALPGVRIRIVDGEGKELGADEVGEIQILSPNNMLEYWKLPDATANTMSPDGWISTGDAGYMDPDGYVYVHDRIKDMIISGGENVYPAEVESAIFGHPDVQEVAVIGVPDARWGESVKAVCVAKPGHEISPQSIMNWARERIAAYKVPKSVDIIDALPRNASGKILRKELREPYWMGHERRVN
ncbi:MAG: fatty acid--CoA ligase [Hyphomonas sp.]